MILEGYGVKLRRLTETDLELLRCWRNDPKIQQYMEYRDYITKEMQSKWFQRINNDNNYYFIIEYEAEDIGMINIRDIDYDEGVGEPGMFIYKDEYLNSDIAFRASFCMGDFIWNNLNLKKLRIHVLRDNRRAIEYNKFFGYKLSEGQEYVQNQEYILTKDDADNKRVQRLKRYVR